MTVSSWNLSFILILVLNVVQGTLTPNGKVSVDCGSTKTFTCSATGEPIEWTTSGLRGVSRGPFLARKEANSQDRITSHDSGDDLQVGMSMITISGFSLSDDGGIIQCVNANNSNVLGVASISIDLLPLPPPTNVTATVESCDVKLQWTQPNEHDGTTTSVSCTPHSPGCAECTTSPCNITGLNPSTEYEFTVTLNSGQCRTNTSTTTARTRDLNAPTNLSAAVESCDSIILKWTQPSEPSGITTTVSCTPHLPGCAECTTSPCNITGLTPSTEYEFTVTLNSGGCRASMNSTVVKTNDGSSCATLNSTSNAPLAALVLLLLLIPLLYPLGVLIVYFLFFKDKTYCEVFWCCFCWRKDKSYECNYELREHREEAAYQNVPKKEEAVTNGDEMKKPKGSKQEVINTRNVMQQQGNPDGIQYADLDFSEHQPGRIVMIPLVDPVTYADV